MRASSITMMKRILRKPAAGMAKEVPKVEPISTAHAMSATTRLREERARARAEMVGLSKAFTEGTRMQELTAAKTTPMANGQLTSKATGGALYTMQPVRSSADLYREARQGGGAMSMDGAATYVNSSSSSSGSGSSSRANGAGGSTIPLVGLLALGAAAALAIMEYNGDIADALTGVQGKMTASTDWNAGIEEDNAQASHLAKQPVWLQRQR